MYGLIVTVGIFIALWYAEKEQLYRGKKIEDIWNLFSLVLVLGLIGARIYHVFDYLNYYLQDPVKIVQIYRGGLGIYGAIFGGLTALLLFAKIKKWNRKEIIEVADIAGISVPLGQFVGRWANFFNQELYGLPSKNIFSIYISPEKRPLDYVNYKTFHPLFLYESVGTLIIFIFLFFLRHRFKKLKPGIIFLTYIFLYGLLRIILEPLRIRTWEIANLNVTVVISAILMLPLIIVVIGNIKNYMKNNLIAISIVFTGILISSSIVAYAFITSGNVRGDSKTKTANDMFLKYAKEIKLNAKDFSACFTSFKYKDEVLQDQREGSSKGIKATPTFLVNGYVIEGAYPIDAFSELISLIEKNDKSLEKTARTLVDVKNSYVIGNSDAKITIIEYSDFQCPYCSKFFEDTYPALKSEFIDTGKVKLVFKDFPVTARHKNALTSAIVARCAGEQGKFWEYHDKLLGNQNEWSNL